MYRILILFVITLSHALHASLSLALDALHFKNGNVIKGEIIEHNLAAKKYKIQISDGSILTFTQDELLKIVKVQEPTTSYNNSIIKGNPDVTENNNARKPQQLPNYDYNSSRSAIAPSAADSLQTKEKKYFQVFYSTLSLAHVYLSEVGVSYGRHMGISLSLSDHLTLKYSDVKIQHLKLKYFLCPD